MDFSYRDESVRRGRPVRISCDGRETTAYEGETVAAALLAAGQRVLRWTSRTHQPRGLFCGMGVCFDCLVTIDGRPDQRACQVLVADGMCVQTQQGVGKWPARS